MLKRLSLAVRVLGSSALLLFIAPFVARTAESAAADTGPVANGALPGPFPLFPPTNWWNLDVSGAPVDSNSAAFIAFMFVVVPTYSTSKGTDFLTSRIVTSAVTW